MNRPTNWRRIQALNLTIVVLQMTFGPAQHVVNAQSPSQYHLNWVQNIWGAPADYKIYGRHINESGVVVGNTISQVTGERSAFRFFENQDEVWITEDLNQLGGVWVDLGGSETNIGWTAETAVGINVWGHIVGRASHGAYEYRAYVLRFPAGLPEFTLLPRSGNQSNQGVAINDDDVVVGSGGPDGTIVFTPWTTIPYEPVDLVVDTMSASINNSGVIVVHTGNYSDPIAARVRPVPNGGTYDYAGASIDTFPGRNFTGVNNYGNISGMRQSEGRGRNKTHGGAIRIEVDQLGNVLDEVLLASGDSPFELLSGGINDADNVCYSKNGTPFVDTNVHGPIDLDQLVVNPDNDWLNSDIEPWGINNSGLICGQTSSALKTFVLTPVVAGPGISVSPVAGLTTTEAGGTDTFNVRLDTQPSEAVTVSVNSLDPTEGITSVTSLTFDQSDWNVDQPVTVTGVQDSEYDPDHTYFIEVANASSTVQVEVTNVGDDDIQPPSGSETESISYLPDGLDIPDNNSIGVVSEIQFGNSHVISELTVELNIDHPRPSDLTVNLYGPNDPLLLAPVRLTNFSGDNNVAEFDDMSSDGTWTLELIDNKRRKEGTLDYWSLTVDY